MSEESGVQPERWYSDHSATYGELAKIGASTLESLLTNDCIDCLSVSHRTKTLESFLNKIRRKRYTSPTSEVTDLAGVRVITYIESEARRVCEVVPRAFTVHPEKSFDKSEELGIDRVGYRSVHFVCDLGVDRTKLPEFARFKDRIFEVQVRTVLQHAWAEIEHDREYKFAGVLPAPLRRRLSVLAGVLELADREFDSLAHDVDEYSARVSEATRDGDLDIEINTASLREYLTTKLSATSGAFEVSMGIDQDSGNKIISELRAFGLTSLADIDALITDDFLKFEGEASAGSTTLLGFLRELMMFTDMDRYFRVAWKRDWTGIEAHGYQALVSRFGEDKVKSLFPRYGIALV